jgi:hypothetical protein
MVFERACCRRRFRCASARTTPLALPGRWRSCAWTIHNESCFREWVREPASSALFRRRRPRRRMRRMFQASGQGRYRQTFPALATLEVTTAVSTPAGRPAQEEEEGRRARLSVEEARAPQEHLPAETEEASTTVDLRKPERQADRRQVARRVLVERVDHPSALALAVTIRRRSTSPRCRAAVAVVWGRRRLLAARGGLRRSGSLSLAFGSAARLRGAQQLSEQPSRPFRFIPQELSTAEYLQRLSADHPKRTGIPSAISACRPMSSARARRRNSSKELPLVEIGSDHIRSCSVARGEQLGGDG